MQGCYCIAKFLNFKNQIKMKTNFIKYGAFIAAIVFTTAASAQKKPATKKAHVSHGYSNMYSSENGDGKEHIRTEENGKEYELTMQNGKLTELYVDGEKIPESKFGDYADFIARMKEQIKRDKIQARKDQEQALRDQAQARRDQEQAKRDQEQARRDQAQAGKDQEQAKRDQEQASRDQEQAKRDQEQAVKEQASAKLDQEQAARDQEQAKRDQEQASRDQEQARRDQEQAKRDQIQAKKDQELMKQLISDLVKDGIVPDEKGLHELTISTDGMTVNGKQMSADVYSKYKSKYTRFSGSSIRYHNEGNSRGISINRTDN